MSSFLEEAKAATEQRRKSEMEAKEAAKKLEGPVETLDEIVEAVYKVMMENTLREIKEGRPLKETITKSNGLFKPKTTTEIEYVYASVRIYVKDSAYFAVRHIRTNHTDEYNEVYRFSDRFDIRLIERNQLFTLKTMLRQKFYADDIECAFRLIKFPDKKTEKWEKERYNCKDGYIWEETELQCKYNLKP